MNAKQKKIGSHLSINLRADGKSANVQKEKYEKHRNVLVFFFAFAMLVVLNSQKLSLRELNINLASFERTDLEP